MTGRHALRSWDHLAARATVDRLLVLADYDGTLVPIVADPQASRLSQGLRGLLRRLSAQRGLSLGIVSGRALRWVREAVGIRGVVYVGNHGLEIAGPGLRWTHPMAERSRPLLSRLARTLRGVVRPFSGSRVEDKTLSLSLHWRGVTPSYRPALRREALRRLGPWVARRAIRLTAGKCVLEVRPPTAWGKETAVDWVRRRGHFQWRQVWYLGDDRTDEAVLQAVAREGGVAIRVGPSVHAKPPLWWVRTPGETVALLGKLLEARMVPGCGASRRSS